MSYLAKLFLQFIESDLFTVIFIFTLLLAVGWAMCKAFDWKLDLNDKGGRIGLIDDKGRIFGRINVVDLVVVIIILSIIPLIIKGFTLAPKEKTVEDKIRFEIQVEERAKINKEMEDQKRDAEAWCTGYKAGYLEGKRKDD